MFFFGFFSPYFLIIYSTLRATTSTTITTRPNMTTTTTGPRLKTSPRYVLFCFLYFFSYLFTIYRVTVTNFPFLVHYLRLMLDQHAFACFVLFSNVPFPCVNGMYFIHAYSSRLPYSLHAFYLMYITRLPRLRLILS